MKTQEEIRRESEYIKIRIAVRQLTAIYSDADLAKQTSYQRKIQLESQFPYLKDLPQ